MRECASVRVHAMHGSPFDAIDTVRGIGPHRDIDRINILIAVVVFVVAAVVDDDDNSGSNILASASAVID